MDKLVGKISFFQVCMIFMLMNGLMSHVIINPMLLDAAGRDAWISVLLAGLLYLPWCALLVLFMKRSGQQKLQPWLAGKTNLVVSWMIVIPICLQLYLIGLLTILHTSIWTNVNYLPGTPKFALVIVLSLACFFYAASGIRTIAISSGILLPVVVALGFFVSFSNTPQKDFTLLKPIMEHGWQPVLHGMLYAGGGFVELLMIMAVQHRLKPGVQVWKIAIFAVLMVYIAVGPVIGAVTEFGPIEAAKQSESPYEQWRLVKLGSDIEHVDFLSVFQWESGAIIRGAFAQFLLGELLPFANARQRFRFNLFVTISYIAISMLPFEKYTLYLWVYRFYLPISFAAALSVSIVCLSISLFSKKFKEEAA
ncbi:endospore germination permease [Paenibacillus arenilitoris]|uniref:Endospore germination permease n=1 Tax=Paenibacillus arenilitoris TaxID=2772299 RepID=A0A927CIS0_9BACL|nr:endospore germination permease [Paenibacillus arenilitoris]MBD2868230.1 endospore germination permease [Paenibacillus arenilitoris]